MHCEVANKGDLSRIFISSGLLASGWKSIITIFLMTQLAMYCNF